MWRVSVAAARMPSVLMSTDETTPFIPTPPPTIFFLLDGMVGCLSIGPSPVRETSKIAIRLSEPAMKCVPEAVKAKE